MATAPARLPAPYDGIVALYRRAHRAAEHEFEERLRDYIEGLQRTDRDVVLRAIQEGHLPIG